MYVEHVTISPNLAKMAYIYKLLFLNIASLPKHIDELRLNMQHQYLDILVLNETRLDETISNSEISIDKYTLVRNDRTRHGGGVAMYIRNSINFNLRNDLHDEALEFLCVEISKPKVKPFLISTWYRPPNSCKDLFDKLQVILDKIEFLGIENNIIGDLNCNMHECIYCR